MVVGLAHFTFCQTSFSPQKPASPHARILPISASIGVDLEPLKVLKFPLITELDCQIDLVAARPKLRSVRSNHLF